MMTTMMVVTLSLNGHERLVLSYLVMCIVHERGKQMFVIIGKTFSSPIIAIHEIDNTIPYLTFLSI